MESSTPYSIAILVEASLTPSPCGKDLHTGKESRAFKGKKAVILPLKDGRDKGIELWGRIAVHLGRNSESLTPSPY